MKTSTGLQLCFALMLCGLLGCAAASDPMIAPAATQAARPAVRADFRSLSYKVGLLEKSRAPRPVQYSEPFAGALQETATQPVISPDTTPWKTRAAFEWTAWKLIVYVESIGPQPSSAFTQRDDNLHQADVIELFLDPTGEGKRIVEIQVSPSNVIADYLHTWEKPATYPAAQIDVDFYRAFHKADKTWNLPGLWTSSQVEPLADGQTRWAVTMHIPFEALDALSDSPGSVKSPEARTMRANVLRYAYTDKQNFLQFNLVPVLQGRPHQSPMAMVDLILERDVNR